MTKLALAIRAAAVRAPGSMRALARQAGVPATTLSQVIRGERSATEELARKILRALRRWGAATADAAARIERALPADD